MGTRYRSKNGAAKALIGLVTLVAAACFVLYNIIVFVTPGPVLDDRPVPSGQQVEFKYEPPLAVEPEPKVRITSAAADEVLRAMVSRKAFEPFSDKQTKIAEVYAGPYASSCTGLMSEISPRAGMIRRARTGPYSVTVTAWSYSAGTAAYAVATLKERIATCYPLRDPRPYLSSTSVPADGFAASATNSGDGIMWAVWSRGDIVITTTLTAAGASAPSSATTAVANRLDDFLVTKLRQFECVNTNPAVGQAGRSPYAPVPYTGLTKSFTVKAPSTPKVPAPTKLPDDYKKPKYSFPQPQEVPELAPYIIPLTWPADQEFPELEDLPTLPAPQLVVPEGIDEFPVPVPSTVEPAAPAAPETEQQIAAPAVDVQGPGCGWDFTKTVPAIQDQEQLDAVRDQRIESAFVSLTKQAASQMQAQISWAKDYQQWLADAQTQQVYGSYAAERDSFVAAYDAAVAAYQESLDAYDALYEQWLEAQEPTEEPTPTDSPSPSDSPSATPTDDSTLLPSLSPSPSQGRTP